MRLCLALLVALSFEAVTAEPQLGDGGRFEWGYKLQTPESGPPVTAGQYYVRLPETSGAGGEQRVSYQADDSGYHGAVAITTRGQHHAHAHTFALGQPAIALLRNQKIFQEKQNGHNGTNGQAPDQLMPQNSDGQPQLEYFLFQQQFVSPTNFPNVNVHNLQNDRQLQYKILSPSSSNNILSTPSLYRGDKSKNDKVEDNDRSSPLSEEVTPELGSKGTEAYHVNPVQVFKDHNCSQEGDSDHSMDEVNYEKLDKLYADIPSYNEKNLANTKTYNQLSISHPNESDEKFDERNNARNERIYFIKSSNYSQSLADKLIEDGISKLVLSTQDLISNEDLLTINRAIEKDGYIDDALKATPKYSFHPEPSRDYGHNVFHNPERNRITVRAKLENIVDDEKEHTEENSEQVLQTSSNEYKFATPIVVQDSTVGDYKNQIMNNLVSTIVPYLEKGYEIDSIRQSPEDNNQSFNIDDVHETAVNVTPRPLSQKYLAAITVGLRLLNSNYSDILNNVDDHEASDSEIVSNTIKKPDSGETIVEILESIPYDEVHINDVVVHEWDDEKSQNKAFKISKSQRNHGDIIKPSRNMMHSNKDNIVFYRNTKTNENHNFSQNEGHGGRQLSHPNGNEEDIQAQSSNFNHERKEFISAYNNNFGEKLVQPIIIEKEIPVTKYVDRFIEKQVPYPEPIEVIKEVQVEKRVPYPVAVETIVEKPVEVTKYVDRPQPYPVKVPHPYPIEVKVPYPVEKNVYIEKPIHIAVPYETIVEKQVLHPIAIPTPVAVPVEVRVPYEQKVLYPVAVDRPVAVPYEVEKRVPYETFIEKQVPVILPIEKRVPYPVPYHTQIPIPIEIEKRVPVSVEKIVEKPVTITRFVEKPVHIQVPVPHPVAFPVHVPQPYPVDRIIERKVPYPVSVEKIVEKKVEVPIKVPYPVDRVVEKIVEKPVLVTRFINKPYPVEKRIPYPVEKIVEKRIPFPVHVQLENKLPYQVGKLADRPMHIPFKVPYSPEKIYNVPYAFQRPDYFLPQKADQKTINDQYRQLASNLATVYHLYPYNTVNPLLQQNLTFNKSINQKETKNAVNSAVKSTPWGNLYASKYQHTKTTPSQHKTSFAKESTSLNKYLNYVTNTFPRSDQYYGPPPTETANYWENTNMPKNQIVEFKLRRTDRTPKVNNLRIEYGGFKPPLIPSTQVDLDGIPVEHDRKT